jgi:hypothetical protein
VFLKKNVEILGQDLGSEFRKYISNFKFDGELRFALLTPLRLVILSENKEDN